MKNKILIYSFVCLLLVASFFSGFQTNKTQAVAALGFGGHLIKIMPCTCSVSYWFLYAPIADSPFPGGLLSYVPWSKPYSYYSALPGVWHLGQYLPGVQTCWMYAGVTCFMLPMVGVITQVGTSLTPTPFN